MSIFTKHKSKGAFGTPLICPICVQADDYDVRKQVWLKDRWITPHLVRYVCKKCKTPIRYEVSKYQKSAGELNKLGLIR